MFAGALAGRRELNLSLSAICDSNPIRLDAYRRKLACEHRLAPAQVPATQFDLLLRDPALDTVIICTPDNTHADYICRTLEAGKNVIVEKPIAINALQCSKILSALRNHPEANVKVTFNCRFIPWVRQLKRLITSGVIGEIVHAELNWTLDTRKGVTYFARWHSDKEISGGLIIHKACHHLDLLHYLLDAVPERVFASGRRAFFGSENKHKHGIGEVAGHYFDADGAKGDPFALHSPLMEQNRELLLRAAASDGYRPDRSVWRPGISIEDTMNVQVECTGGQSYHYSLMAFSPRAGRRLTLYGTGGQIDFCSESYSGASGKPLPPGATEAASTREYLIVHPLFSVPYTLQVERADGGHEGADEPMLDGIFNPPADEDEFNLRPGAEQGVLATLTGAAANICFETHEAVDIFRLCPELPRKTSLKEYLR
jgi:predicted dehydrogenase